MFCPNGITVTTGGHIDPTTLDREGLILRIAATSISVIDFSDGTTTQTMYFLTGVEFVAVPINCVDIYIASGTGSLTTGVEI